MRRIIAWTLAASLTAAGTILGAGGAEAATPSTIYYYDTWKTAPTYREPTATVSRAGWLYAGSNYFYCQENSGAEYIDGANRNHWWAKTDDDSGNINVWISDVYITAGGNDAPVPGLPVC